MKRVLDGELVQDAYQTSEIDNRMELLIRKRHRDAVVLGSLRLICGRHQTRLAKQP